LSVLAKKKEAKNTSAKMIASLRFLARMTSILFEKQIIISLLKMTCKITCAFAIAFIVAAIYMFFTSKSTADIIEKTLDNDQKEIYKQIVRERLKIYYIGSLVGLFLAVLYVIFYYKKQPTLYLICSFVVIFFVTQIVVYMIYPKSLYMLDYINTNEQAKAWMEVYNKMMRNYMIGFVLGLIGFGLLCLAFYR
jgi:uncharacterized membrane protein YfcA